MVIVTVANYFKRVMYKHVIRFFKYTYFLIWLIAKYQTTNFAKFCHGLFEMTFCYQNFSLKYLLFFLNLNWWISV